MKRIFYFLREYKDKTKLLEEIEELKEKVEILESKLIQQNMLMLVFEKNIKDIIYFKDEKGNFIRINKALSDKFNIDNPEFAVGKNDSNLFKNIDEIHAKESYEDECEVMNNNKPRTGIKEHVVYPNGDDVWQVTDKFPLYNENGEVMGTWGRSVDITEREREREDLEKQKDIDELTKLWNRKCLSKIIDQKIEALLGWRNDVAEFGSFSLVFIDLNGFKQVNDTYGHDAGDIVLKEVSSFIKSRIRGKIDIFGRWGGDEFIILYPNINEKLTRKLVNKIQEQIKDVEIEVVASKDNEKHKLNLAFSKGIVDFKQCISKEQFEIFKDMFNKMESDIKRKKRGKQLRSKDQKKINMINETKNDFIKAYKLAKGNLGNDKTNIINIQLLMNNLQENPEVKETMVEIIKNVFIYIADREMYKDKEKNL